MLTEISLGRPRIFNAAGSNRLSGSMHRVCGSAGPPERFVSPLKDAEADPCRNYASQSTS